MPTPSAFAAPRALVRRLDWAFTADGPAGAPVSSLYTFPGRGLARRWRGARPPGSFRRLYGGSTPPFRVARPVARPGRGRPGGPRHVAAPRTALALAARESP